MTASASGGCSSSRSSSDMGLIVRQAGDPIEDGDSRDASEVEAELVTIHTEINGLLDNANLSASAELSGSKFLNGSITATQIAADTVTTSKIAQSAVMQGQVETATDSSGVSFTTSTSNVDVPGFSGVTVTPGSNSDALFIDFTASVSLAASNTATYMFAISVGGSDTDCQEVGFVTTASRNNPQVLHVSYMVVPATTAALVVKPRYRQLAATSTPFFVADSLRVLRVLSIPIK